MSYICNFKLVELSLRNLVLISLTKIYISRQAIEKGRAQPNPSTSHLIIMPGQKYQWPIQH